MFLECGNASEIHQAPVASVGRIVASPSETADLEVLLAEETLDIRDETPVLFMQYQEHFFLHLKGIRRHTSNDLEVLNHFIILFGRVPEVDVDAQAGVGEFHKSQLLYGGSTVSGQHAEVHTTLEVLCLPSSGLPASSRHIGEVFTPSLRIHFIVNLQLPGDHAAPEALVIVIEDVQHAVLIYEILWELMFHLSSSCQRL